MDDTVDTRNLYEFALTKAGHEVQTASDGSEALQCLEREKGAFDVMVLDLEMPVMNGWAAMSEIRKRPDFQHLPVLVWTAYYGSHLKSAAKAVGVKYIMRKPIMPNELLREIEKCVHGQAVRNQAQP